MAQVTKFNISPEEYQKKPEESEAEYKVRIQNLQNTSRINPEFIKSVSEELNRPATPRVAELPGMPTSPDVVSQPPIDVRKDIETRAQQRLEAYNRIFADLIARRKEKEQEQLAQARGIAVRSGLSGSSFVGQQQEPIKRAAEEDIQNIAAKQALAIQDLQKNVESSIREEEIFALSKQQAGEQRTALQLQQAQQQMEKNRGRGLELLTAAASQGGQYESISPEIRQSIKKLTGQSDSELELYYKSLPGSKSNFKFETEGGKIFVWETNESTGQIKRRPDLDVAAPAVGGSFKQISDASGQVYLAPDKIDWSLKDTDPKAFSEQFVKLGGPKKIAGQLDERVYESNLDALIGNTPNLIASENGKEAFAKSIARSRNEADKINAVATVVLKNSPADIRTDFVNQTTGIRQIDKAIAKIDEGVKTGFINNAVQYGFNVFGKDFDPKLSSINSLITAAIQPYRNSVTGAAWGEQEDEEYAVLFGSTKYSPQELRNRLVNIKKIMTEKSADALNAQINPTSEYNPFTKPNNVLRSPDGTQEVYIDDLSADQITEAQTAGWK